MTVPDSANVATAESVMAIADVLYLHVAQDESVWYGNESALAINSRQTALAFCCSDLLRKASQVRLSGVASNARLIRDLCDVGVPAMLCSPAAISGRSPQEVLPRLWLATNSRAAEVRWYPLIKADWAAYALTAAAGCPDHSDHAILQLHPAWPALDYLGAEREPAIKLLSTIVDPRWFIHPLHLGRLHRLHKYLGLDPMNAAAMLASVEDPQGRNYRRAANAVRTWLHCPPGDLTRMSPGQGNFVLRTYLAADRRVPGLLTATKRFIRFVCEVWTGHFDAGIFFAEDESEMARWLDYSLRFKAMGRQ